MHNKIITMMILSLTACNSFIEEPEDFWQEYVAKDCDLVRDCDYERIAINDGIDHSALECYPEGRDQRWMAQVYNEAYPTPYECTFHPEAAELCIASEEWTCTAAGDSESEHCDGGESWCVEPDPICSCVFYCGGELSYQCDKLYERHKSSLGNQTDYHHP